MTRKKKAAKKAGPPVFTDRALAREWDKRIDQKEAAGVKVREKHLGTMIQTGTDRMMRYRKDPACPKCGKRPLVCMGRRGGYAALRCRHCGHRFEIGKRPK